MESVTPAAAPPAEVVETLKSLLAEHTKKDPSTWSAESKLEDIGLDSFDLVEFVFKIEDHYKIEIDYNANRNVDGSKTLGDMAAEIQKRLDAKAGQVAGA